MAAWREAGVTRLILGVQSFEADTLATLERSYGPRRAAMALKRCLAFGECNLGIELTFTVPGQTPEVFRSDLVRLAELGVPHSVFGNEYVAADDESVDPAPAAEMLDQLVVWAARHQLGRYEIASFCRPGRESRHNRLYWDGGEFLGLGLGAASFTLRNGEPQRRRNVADPEAYVSGADPEFERAIEVDEYLRQRLGLALRHRAGLDWQTVREQFREAVPEQWLEAAAAALEWAVDREFGTWDGTRCRPTDRGLDGADGLEARLRSKIDGSS